MNNNTSIAKNNSNNKVIITSSNFPNKPSPNLRLIQNSSGNAGQVSITSSTKDHEFYKKHQKELFINFRSPSCDKKIDILQFTNDATFEQNLSSKEIFIQREKVEMKKDGPSFGAGTEFGKEAREEARIRRMTLNKRKMEQKEPINMCIGRGKSAKKYKAMRVSMFENSQYCVFIRASADTFEAIPVRDWFKMQLEVTNKYAKYEDALEEMQKLDKNKECTTSILNKKYASDMDVIAQKKARKTQDDEIGNEMMYSEKLVLTNNDKDYDSDSSENGEKELVRKKKNAALLKKIKLGNEHDCEESDVDDHQGDEVDYMTHSSSDEDILPDEEKEKIYAMNNIDEEISNNSDDDEEEHEDVNDNPKENEADKRTEVKDEESLGDSDSDDSLSISSMDESEDSTNDMPGIRSHKFGDLIKATSNTNNSNGGSTNSNQLASQLIQQRKATSGITSITGVINSFSGSTTSSLPNSMQVSSHRQDDRTSKLENMAVTQEMSKYLMRKPISKSNLFQKLVNKRLLSADSFKTYEMLLDQLNTTTQIVNGEKLFSLQG